MKDTLKPGVTHRMTYTVPQNRTVPFLLPESDDFASMPEVLATGYMIGLIEWTCMEALHGHLDEDEITLGTHVDLSHSAPTVVGAQVVIDVTVTAVEGRSLTFSVTARDDYAVISTGTHLRGVVSRPRFVSRLPEV